MKTLYVLLYGTIVFPLWPMLAIYVLGFIYGCVFFIYDVSGRGILNTLLSGLCMVSGMTAVKLVFAFQGYHLGPTWTYRRRTPILIGALVAGLLFFVLSTPILSFHLEGR